jgi:threonine/homoserine/homoserine lactone efflux protein
VLDSGELSREEEDGRRRRLWLAVGLSTGAAVVVAAVVAGVVVGTRPEQAFVGTAGLEEP